MFSSPFEYTFNLVYLLPLSASLHLQYYFSFRTSNLSLVHITTKGGWGEQNVPFDSSVFPKVDGCPQSISNYTSSSHLPLFTHFPTLYK
uniref:Secreted protein n=1 Tax=Caenorhabditis tropicalis TaxID=1561998 RepID=A0A1I7UUD4_9PELO